MKSATNPQPVPSGPSRFLLANDYRKRMYKAISEAESEDVLFPMITVRKAFIEQLGLELTWHRLLMLNDIPLSEVLHGKGDYKYYLLSLEQAESLGIISQA